jgi:hypothetical protein
MNWKTIKNDGLPKPKIETKNGMRTMEASVELLCSAGGTIWHDFFDPEMDAEHFYKNVTHYIRVDEIPVPNTK